MIMKKSDDKFVQEAKVLFDQSVDRLDAAALSRLNRSRQRALEEVRKPQVGWMRWAPVSGAVVALLAVILLTQPGTGVDEPPPAVVDMDIVLGGENIEMLEDLEFYAWIDALEQDDEIG